jgi:hypothetical protein
MGDVINLLRRIKEYKIDGLFEKVKLMEADCDKYFEVYCNQIEVVNTLHEKLERVQGQDVNADTEMIISSLMDEIKDAECLRDKYKKVYCQAMYDRIGLVRQAGRDIKSLYL